MLQVYFRYKNYFYWKTRLMYETSVTTVDVAAARWIAYEPITN